MSGLEGQRGKNISNTILWVLRMGQPGKMYVYNLYSFIRVKDNYPSFPPTPTPPPRFFPIKAADALGKPLHVTLLYKPILKEAKRLMTPGTQEAETKALHVQGQSGQPGKARP